MITCGDCKHWTRAKHVMADALKIEDMKSFKWGYCTNGTANHYMGHQIKPELGQTTKRYFGCNQAEQKPLDGCIE